MFILPGTFRSKQMEFVGKNAGLRNSQIFVLALKQLMTSCVHFFLFLTAFLGGAITQIFSSTQSLKSGLWLGHSRKANLFPSQRKDVGQIK